MKTKFEASQLISRAYKGHCNIMTPDKIAFGWINDNMAYELSHGIGLEPASHIYGVTIVSEIGTAVKKEFDISQCFDSLQKAEEYIGKMKEKPKKGKV